MFCTHNSPPQQLHKWLHIFDSSLAQVAEELKKLRSEVEAAEAKEKEMSMLRSSYKSHYRSRYGHLKPLDPKSVLGDHWDIDPSVIADVAYTQPEEAIPEPPEPVEGQEGGFTRSKKEPIPPEPLLVSGLSLDDLKDHSVVMESRVRWLNHLSNMLPLKTQNREARKSLTAERMETEEVVAAYGQVIVFCETEGIAAFVSRLESTTEYLGPGNIIELAELCPAPPGSPNSRDKEAAWEKVLQKRPDWNSHLNGGSLRYWKGIKKDQYTVMNN